MRDVLKKVMKTNKDIVLSQTWGHLYPDNKPHKGYIIYTFTAYGVYECIDCHFDKVEDSPWFFQDLNEFISRKITGRGEKKEGTIYMFTGTYRKLKNQGYVFKGKTKRMMAKKLLSYA